MSTAATVSTEMAGCGAPSSATTGSCWRPARTQSRAGTRAVRGSYGLKTLTQAQILRDHVIARLDPADAAQSPQERLEPATVVVVGAGYAGTELAAQLKGVTDSALDRWGCLRLDEVCFLLVDASDRVMPEPGEHLGDASVTLLRSRGNVARRRLGRRLRRGRCCRLEDYSRLEDDKHHDLGLVADFGRRGAAPRPLGVPLTGLPAKAVTLGHHVVAVPTLAGRARVLADLVLAAALPSQTT